MVIVGVLYPLGLLATSREDGDLLQPADGRWGEAVAAVVK